MKKIGLTQITTGPSIEGWDIKGYCGPVSASVVAGTGIFSDFAAGLADFFGGRSGVYQRELDAIRAEVLEQLGRAAVAQGANWVIGLSLDFDEISGKGKQMLMVSAIGTAVVATCRGEQDTCIANSVSCRQVNSVITRSRLLASIKDGRLVDNQESRQGIVDEVVAEGLPWFFERQVLASQNATVLQAKDYDPFIDQLIRNMELAQQGSASMWLYDCLASVRPGGASMVIAAIVRNYMVSHSRILDALYLDDSNYRIRCLQTLRGDALLYSAADIPILRGIQGICEAGFPIQAKLVEKKGILGEKTFFRCSCGSDFYDATQDGHCPGCGRDPFGFFASDLRPADAAVIAADRAQALESALA